MKTLKLFAVLVVAISIFGCAGNAKKDCQKMDSLSKSDSIRQTDSRAYEEKVSSSAAVEKHKDSTRKFIRTAELKFKVKNVIKSTYNIEDITAHFQIKFLFYKYFFIY